jgi:PadR family transcriptional regulator AphA
MSLEHAILGFLNYGTSSGYDLKKMFDASVKHFWTADQSQIYRSLSRLVEKGWAEIRLVEQTKRPDRKEYSITIAGREELRWWLSTPVPSEETRIAALIQVFFAAQLSDEEAITILTGIADQLRGKLHDLNKVPMVSAKYSEKVKSPRDTFFWMLTLDLGIRSVEAQLAWAEDAITRIKDKRYTVGSSRRAPD